MIIGYNDSFIYEVTIEGQNKSIEALRLSKKAGYDFNHTFNIILL